MKFSSYIRWAKLISSQICSILLLFSLYNAPFSRLTFLYKVSWHSFSSVPYLRGRPFILFVSHSLFFRSLVDCFWFYAHCYEHKLTRISSSKKWFHTTISDQSIPVKSNDFLVKCVINNNKSLWKIGISAPMSNDRRINSFEIVAGLAKACKTFYSIYSVFALWLFYA